MFIMICGFRLALSSIFTTCSLTRALIPNLYNISSLSSPPAGVHCTTDPGWLARGFPIVPTYEYMCFAATQKATMDLRSYSLTTEYEFLDRGATAQTTRPKIPLPRKYVAGMWNTAAFTHRSIGVKGSLDRDFDARGLEER